MGILTYTTSSLEDAALTAKLDAVNSERAKESYVPYTAQDLFNVWVQSMLFSHIHDLQVAGHEAVPPLGTDIPNRFGTPTPIVVDPDPPPFVETPVVETPTNEVTIHAVRVLEPPPVLSTPRKSYNPLAVWGRILRAE